MLAIYLCYIRLLEIKQTRSMTILTINGVFFIEIQITFTYHVVKLMEL